MSEVSREIDMERRLCSIEGKLDIVLEQKEQIANLYERINSIERELERKKGERTMILIIGSVLGTVVTTLLSLYGKYVVGGH